MVEIKVQASDSAAAMEEVEKRLGSDALIVSTTKVDGKIEIIATDDDPSKYKKLSEPLLLDSDYRVSNFSDILGDQVKKTKSESNKSLDSVENSAFEESLNSIKSELKKLEKLSQVDIKSEQASDENIVQNLLRSAGINKNVIDLLGINASDDNIEEIAKKLAKLFVHGKCPHFENSDVFLIVGSPFSGKTVLAKKLMRFLKNREEVKDCTNLEGNTLKEIVSHVTSWATKISDNEKTSRKLAIAELSNIADVERALISINQNNPKLKISIINVCEVGKSYQFLRRNFSKRSLDNEYLAITKLDLCDLSLSEISAFVELNHKCMFFSGMETETDGLFFAQVDKVKSHLVQTIENEKVL